MTKQHSFVLLFLLLLSSVGCSDGDGKKNAEAFAGGAEESASVKSDLHRGGSWRGHNQVAFETVGSMVNDIATAGAMQELFPVCSPMRYERVSLGNAYEILSAQLKKGRTEEDYELLTQLAKTFDQYGNSIVAIRASSKAGLGRESLLHIAFPKFGDLPPLFSERGRKLNFLIGPIPGPDDNPIYFCETCDPDPLGCCGGEHCGCVVMPSNVPCSGPRGTGGGPGHPYAGFGVAEASGFNDGPGGDCRLVDCCWRPPEACGSILDSCGQAMSTGCASPIPVVKLPFGVIPQELLAVDAD